MPPTIRRKPGFLRGQFDLGCRGPTSHWLQLDYAQAAIKCQQLNNMTGLSLLRQQHAVLVSIGYRLCAERQPPRF